MWTLLLAAVTTVNAAALEFPDARFSLAVYCQPTCPDELGEMVEKALAPIATVSTLSRAPTRAERISKVVKVEAYGRPDIGKMRQLGRKLNGWELEALGRSQEVFVTRVAAPRTEALGAIRQVYGVFAQVEEQYAFVLDESPSGRIYTARDFPAHAKAITTAPLDTSVAYEIMVTAGESDDRVLETVGLRALGLPDLRVASVAVEDVDARSRVIDLVAQSLFERGELSTKFKVKGATLLQPNARQRATGVSGKVRLKAVPASLGRIPDPRLIVEFRGSIEAAPLAQVAPEEVALAAELEPSPVKPQEAPKAEEETLTAEGRDVEVDEQVLDELEEEGEAAEKAGPATADEPDPEPAQAPLTAAAMGWGTVEDAPAPAPEAEPEPAVAEEPSPEEPTAEAPVEEAPVEEAPVEEAPVAEEPALEESPAHVTEVAVVEDGVTALNASPDATDPMGTPGTILHPPQKRATKAWKQLEREHRSALRTFLGPVRQAYVDGLPEGDELFVKVPFPAGRDRVEYLWLRVDSWNGREIMAELVSLPAWVGQLYPGAMLALIETTVFDYLWRRADETEVGNTTQDLLAVD